MTQEKRPIDIPLERGVLLPGGAIFVHLPTLDKWDAFWREHRKSFNFACQGYEGKGDPIFLNPYDWVFAPSKDALVKTVLRWDEIGFTCKWFDWARENPADWKFALADTASYIAERKNKNLWTAVDETSHQQSAVACGGNWELIAPERCVIDYDELFNCVDNFMSNDPNLPSAQAEFMVQEGIFDYLLDAAPWEIQFYDEASLDEEIAYWKVERIAGCEYYGCENE
ncbi:MAG: hypothetical protein IPP88_09385 [Betaproteobacteria bacterium]|nr:hypothetical protein [Betaproteobacteria bacterium]